jgi:hypothetical protein
MSSLLNANNQMSSLETYIKRNLYDVIAYEEGYYGPEAVTDFQFGERMLYGRLNQFGQPIEISDEIFLSSVNVKNSRVRLINFVADAFMEMSKKIERDKRSGKIPANTPILSDFKPMKGYVSPESVMKKYRKNLYEAFKIYIKNNGLDKHILDFDSFSEHFMSFNKNVVQLGFACTRSGVFKSRSADPAMSGLVVDLQEYNFSDDAQKIEFIRSDSFSYYADLALKYGFSINKHIPTRLVADLDSPFMKKYLDYKVAGGIPGLFRTQYRETYINGFAQFKRDMARFYNQYVTERPRIAGYKLHDNGNISKQMTERKPRPENDIIAEKKPRYFINKYIEVRNLEEGNRLEKAKLDYLKKRAEDLERIYDENYAIFYVEKEFSTPSMEANSYHGLRKRVNKS